ncbi:hypothetical protein THAOC_13953, partial [Thalassiosira oceanica]
MKLSVALLASTVGLSAAAAPKASITAGSKVGQKVLSRARRLEQNENGEIDYTWVAN